MLKKNRKFYLTLGFALLIGVLFCSGMNVMAEESIETEFKEYGSEMMVKMKYIGLGGLLIGGYIIYKVQKNK